MREQMLISIYCRNVKISTIPAFGTILESTSQKEVSITILSVTEFPITSWFLVNVQGLGLIKLHLN